MRDSVFKKSILISTFCHFTVFGLFSFSSGTRLSQLNYPPVSFFGGILGNYAFTAGARPDTLDTKKAFFNRVNAVPLGRDSQAPSVGAYYLKPPVNLAFRENKETALRRAVPAFSGLPKKESVVMFYPQLPYHFLLYFKDRQTVHIELAFNIISNTNATSIEIKRKISSGNLEADLLAIRYLSHYLFVQQTGLPLNTWQSVKIELSPKND